MVHFTSGQMNEKGGLVQRRLNIIIIIVIYLLIFLDPKKFASSETTQMV